MGERISFIRTSRWRNETGNSIRKYAYDLRSNERSIFPGCRIIFYFILKMKNGTRDWRRRGRGEGDERAFPARQFRSRGEIDRDDVQIILF